MNVCIKVKDPILRCYLAALFKQRGDGFVVTAHTLTGAAIISQVTESVRPVPFDKKEKDQVQFYLPRSRYTDELRGRFLYISEDAQQIINLTLKKEFDTNFLAYVTERLMQGLKLKDIIPLFINDAKLDIFDGDIETLKKRYYRKELELLEKRKEMLRKKAYMALKKVKKQLTKRVNA